MGAATRPTASSFAGAEKTKQLAALARLLHPAQPTFEESLAQAVRSACETINTATPPEAINVSGGCRFRSLADQGEEWRRRAIQETRFAPRFLSFSAGLKQHTFAYASTPSLEPQEVSRQSFNLGAGIGRLFPLIRTYAGLGILIEEVHKSGKTFEICRPIPETLGEQCQELALSPPERKEQHILQGEVRTSITDAVAVLGRIQREFREDITAVQLATFFLPASTGGLTGGIEVGHRFDKNETSARIFIGTVFRLFPAP
jgi:hypothetical protein